MITGKQFQEWRRARGLTVEEVAKALDVSHRTIEGWETRDAIPDVKQGAVLRVMEREFLHIQLDPEVYDRVATLAAKEGVPVNVLVNALLAEL